MIFPAKAASNAPPMPPIMPPMPVTLPTARFGNMSETVVNRFALQPWCAAVASEMSAIARTRLDVIDAKKIGTTQSAQMSIVVFRARFTDQPRLMNFVASQPKKMLPPSEIR